MAKCIDKYQRLAYTLNMEKETNELLEFVSQTEAGKRLGLLRTANSKTPRTFSRQYIHRLLQNKENSIRTNSNKEVCWQDILNIKPKKLGRRKKKDIGTI